MKFNRSAFCIALLLAGTAHAQMYKWVGPDGKISYSDTPPPQNATRVEKKNLTGTASVDTSDMPYELAEAVKNQPVTLYTGSNCAACDDARGYLNKRGIPFKEKTIGTDADVAKLRQLSGKQQLPFLTVGRNKLSGYEIGGWESALSGAGYPATNVLPPTYRNPAPEAAVPPPPPKEDKPAATADTSSRPAELPPTGNAPPGFRF